jgi:hypothetical protein
MYLSDCIVASSVNVYYYGCMKTQQTKPCLVCGGMCVKKTTTSKTSWEKQKFCSWDCMHRAVGLKNRGRRDSDEARAKKSQAMQGERNHRFGVKQSDETIARRGVKARVSEANPLWKGEFVGYSALHSWLNRHYPKTGICEHCGADGKRTEYANLNEHQYARNRADYVELCVACHRALDQQCRSRPKAM